MINEISSTYPIAFTIIWQTSLFIAAGLTASYFWKRHPARAHQVLLLSIIAAVTVPFMTIAVKHLELGIFTAEPGPAAIYPATSEVGIQPLPDLAPSVPAESEKTGLPWSEILLVGWTAASVIFLTRLLLTFILGIHLVKKSRPFKYPKIAESMKAAASKLGIKENMAVYSSKSVSSPVIWCWKRRPILLLPSDKRLLNDKIDLVGILYHELAHVKRRDHVAGLLSELMVVFLPWHPLSWWAKKRLLSLSENACDDWVIAAGGCGMNYAESLLNLLPAEQMAFVPAVVRNKDVIKRRVMRMLRESCENPRLGKKWILSSVLITICISLSVAFAQTKSAGPQKKETSEYAPNKGIHIPMNASDSVSQVVPQISGEAQFALMEAQRLLEANPEDLAAAREPLIGYMETHPEDSVPLIMYQMLGQFWYVDEKNENHIEAANQVFATASAIFPDNDELLLNYAVTTYELEQFENAATLFEDYYNLNENHEIKYLEYAAMTYYNAGNPVDAKRIFSQLIDQVEPPEQQWLDLFISICHETRDFEDAEYYIHQAMDYFPTEVKYRRLLAQTYFLQGDEQAGNAVLKETGLPIPTESEAAAVSDQQQSDSLPYKYEAFQLNEVDTPPRTIREFSPQYPYRAYRDKIKGRVVLRFLVDTDGKAKKAEVITSEPEGVFEESALMAIERYEFEPATLNGEPVVCINKMTVGFALSEH